MQNIKDFWKKAFSLIGEKDIFFNASAITFNLFICAIPFILILISIIGYILSYDAAFNEIVRYGTELIPVFTYEPTETDIIEGEQTLRNILTPLVGARTIFGITGLIILILFTQGLLHSFKHVIFDVFDIKEKKHPVMDMVYNFLGFGVIGAVFVFFSVAISVISILDLSVIKVPYTEIEIRLPWIYDLLDFTLPIIFTFLLIFTIYRFVSERRISIRTSLVGAVFYTLLFTIAKILVSLYMSYAFSSYQYFYQGYAIFIVIGIWAFYTSLLFVISVILTRAFRETYLEEKDPYEENPYAALD
ncbi:MAG: YihY/virulence factor BrkB family protein [Balneola sp.]|nr:MAG: YihY/virulence factor BrkB family protein [Balneola sp.]